MGSEVQEGNKAEKKKPWKWILLIIVLVILSNFIYLSSVIWGEDLEKKGSKENIEDLQKITLQSFPVNLNNLGGNRYLRITITLEYPKDLKAEMDLSQHRIKDVVLNILRSKKVEDIDNPEETELLKQELLKAINARLGGEKITGIYFEEFIIQ